ncbi:hypothetical protein DERF_006887 [Dermatophagoides farinae]|uniref:Uncharacterized protein n=1 Tax=Dermatophagoides farinae TaxID=6954 RepID=A0A922I2A9_DERFA|nr:hypothetical protein DERF_006887 [Dermatophagoides farinae]
MSGHIILAKVSCSRVNAVRYLRNDAVALSPPEWLSLVDEELVDDAAPTLNPCLDIMTFSVY